MDQHIVTTNKQAFGWNCIFCICESIKWNPESSVVRNVPAAHSGLCALHSLHGLSGRCPLINFAKIWHKVTRKYKSVLIIKAEGACCISIHSWLKYLVIKHRNLSKRPTSPVESSMHLISGDLDVRPSQFLSSFVSSSWAESGVLYLSVCEWTLVISVLSVPTADGVDLSDSAVRQAGSASVLENMSEGVDNW